MGLRRRVLGPRVLSLRFRVESTGFRISGLGLRIQGLQRLTVEFTI